MVRSRVKLSLIPDKTSRRTTFKKRKGGIMKKLNELVTLCGVEACAVVYSGPNDANPEAWPSREDAEEVISKFMKFPEVERDKKMYDQDRYTLERIRKEEATLQRLQEENRELELKEIMFDLIKGKRMMEHHSNDASVLYDLGKFIDFNVNELTKRIHMLQANGEPISLFPLEVGAVDAADPAVEDVNPIADADVAAVRMPYGFNFDHIQNMNMNVNQQAPAYLNDHIPYQNVNQQELFHNQVPTNFSGHVQYQNMMNYPEQFQYQVPTNVYDQNQHGFNGLNQGMGLDLNHNLSESFNQYPNLHDQPYMNQWMAQPQQMSYAEELASLASMDNNYYNYHQLPSTSYMPSMDLPALNTNNLPTRFGLE
ncbi:Agamous-like MADS-box protein AGL36 [Hirschfeldia incana]|nr:Agamous-like MADS-box protein AGL36 [Hirschfeldia incana]